VSLWDWIVVGIGSFLVLSLLVGLAVAAVLGSIGRKVSELYETEEWALAPLSRARRAAEPKEQTKRDRVIRLK
jgi:phosphate/sulfate permease